MRKTEACRNSRSTPFWPKPLPNNWILGQVVRHRHRQIRPHLGGASAGLAHAARARRRAQSAGSEVLRRGAAGAGVRRVGQPAALTGAGPGAGYQWPESEHGIFVDDNDFVWLAGNGKKDGQLLKFTMDGKFVLQIGKQGEGNDSNATERLGSPADVAVDVAAQGSVRRRRLRQPPRRRVRFRDRRLQAPLGRLRQQAERREDAALRSGAAAVAAVRQSGALHPALGKDGLIYVCDRTNNRLQMFRKDGTLRLRAHLREGDARQRHGLRPGVLARRGAEASST